MPNNYSFMPHMMPMMWLLIFMSSFLFFFTLIILIYFFYVPNLPLKKSSYLKFHKWNWMW